ncbi:MAG: hypothetical protein U0930_24080 [Pirellulales bacterium]
MEPLIVTIAEIDSNMVIPFFCSGFPILWISSQLRSRFQSVEFNNRLLQGVHDYLKLPNDNVVALQLGRWRLCDDWNEKSIGRQLHAPGDERFPILRQQLPMRCLCRVGKLPALIHPATGRLFGIRVNDFLNLLHLSDASMHEAQQCGAVWASSPLPALRELNLTSHFGPGWCIPNTLHERISTYYYAAFRRAEAD